MNGTRPATPWHQSLRVRMVVLLTVALLPIGLIAVKQTRMVTIGGQLNGELALLSLTRRAAFDEREAIERARGAADVIGAIASELSQNVPNCIRYLSEVVETYPRFGLIGIFGRDGRALCSTAPGVADLSIEPEWQDTRDTTNFRLTIHEDSTEPNLSVINLTSPFRENGVVAGFVRISIPHSALRDELRGAIEGTLLDLITFNGRGEVLTSNLGRDGVAARLPANRALLDFVDGESEAFSAPNASGQDRKFAVAPIFDGVFYALGTWHPDETPNGMLYSDGVPAILFPVVMWLASLVVALLAVHTLITRHLKTMNQKMRRFAEDRELPDTVGETDMPIELKTIDDGFQLMARSILQEEAELEDALRQKNVLFREVHHRVKNNLQLIASIINMQVRKSHEPETIEALRRIQRRVLSLATIHRDLYQTSTAGQVDVGQLVREIVDTTFRSEAGVRVNLTEEIECLRLYPDQAIPLSLLVAEAASNAMKYSGAADGADANVTVTLRQLEDRKVEFVIENSVARATEAERTGMGSQLIRAFAVQLGGDLTIEPSDNRYRFQVAFRAADFVPENPDF